MSESPSATSQQFSMGSAISAIRRHMRSADDTFYLPMMYDVETDEEADKAEIARHCRDAWDLLITALQLVGMRHLLKKALADFATCEKENFNETKQTEDDVFLISTFILDRHVSLLEDLYASSAEKVERQVEELVLMIECAGPHLVSLNMFGWLPAREEDVHVRLEGVLACVYRDLKHKPPITTNPMKNYQPDSGIPSLRTLIEYKFVDSPTRAKEVVDEMKADVLGYQTPEYDTLLFVIYETVPTFSRAHYEASIRATNAPGTVHVRVIAGVAPTAEDLTLSKENGKRRRRSQKQ